MIRIIINVRIIYARFIFHRFSYLRVEQNSLKVLPFALGIILVLIHIVYSYENTWFMFTIITYFITTENIIS